MARKPLLVGDPHLAVRRTHRQDHGPGPPGGAAAVGHALDRAAQRNLGHVIADQLGPEPLGLGTH